MINTVNNGVKGEVIAINPTKEEKTMENVTKTEEKVVKTIQKSTKEEKKAMAKSLEEQYKALKASNPALIAMLKRTALAEEKAVKPTVKVATTTTKGGDTMEDRKWISIGEKALVMACKELKITPDRLEAGKSGIGVLRAKGACGEVRAAVRPGCNDIICHCPISVVKLGKETKGKATMVTILKGITDVEALKGAFIRALKDKVTNAEHNKVTGFVSRGAIVAAKLEAVKEVKAAKRVRVVKTAVQAVANAALAKTETPVV
jgi:hypothetical protein